MFLISALLSAMRFTGIEAMSGTIAAIRIPTRDDISPFDNF